MSTTIDQRVVEMRFDNKHFESNVSTTMSTLEKLKQKLHLDGASKGLESINSASRKVDMSGLGAGVESVSAKFSALQVMGVTALANITNSAVNAGKRIMAALTIDPIKTGFQEYETQINATQTILANTSHKGSTIDDVNRALEELNKYADLTIYNFTEMTRNIGTFTAAGIDLDTSVNAIQGIANLAAVSGSTSQQASTAMYQLSQALAAGTIRLMDWNSVVNAGMGGEIFQKALRETSEALGTGAEAAIEASGSFRESLRDGWLTSQVLTETLKKFTTSGANEYVAKYTGLSVEAVEAALKSAEAQYGEADAIEHASKALAEKSGKNADEIADMLQFAKNATDAATKVKTFTQLWDVLKESAQSGWSQTWKIIVGDFEEAKSLLTPLADFLTGIIGKMSDWRNAILESALGKGFGKLSDTVSKITKPATKAVDTLKGIGDSLKSLDVISDEVISGSWGNWTERFEGLREAGYNYCEVQNEVNKKLNNGFRYTEEQIAAEDKLINKQTESIKKTEDKTEATVELTEADKDHIKNLAKMTEAELRAKGYTEEQIEALRELGRQAEKLGIPLEEFIDNIDQITGRWLLINSFKNIGKGLIDSFKAIKEAWTSIFPPKTTEQIADSLFNVIAAFHKFTSNFRLIDDETGKFTKTGDNIVRTLKGVFAIVDVITTLIGGGFKIAFKVVSEILKYFHLDILDVTAAIGDAAVRFRDWFDSIFDLSGILDLVAPTIKNIANAITQWFSAFKESEGLKNAISYIKEVGASISEWWSSLKNAEDLPKAIAEGIVKFFSSIPTVISTVASNIWDAFTSSFEGFGDNPFGGILDKITAGLSIAGQTIVELGKILLGKLNTFLTAHGFEEISEDAIAGLVNGLKSGAAKAWDAAVEMALNILAKVQEVLGIESPSTEMREIGEYTVEGFVLGIQNGASSILSTIKSVFTKALEWVKQLDFGAIVAAVIGIFGASAIHKISTALTAFASPFAGVGDILSSLGESINKTYKRPIKKILNNTAKVVKSFSNVLNSVAFSVKADAIKTLATAILMLVAAVAVLTFFDPKELWNAVGVIAALSIILVGLAFAMDKLSSASASIDFKKGIDINGLSSGLAGIGIAILLMAGAVKMLGSLDPNQAKQGFLGLAGLVVAIGIVVAAFGLLAKGKTAENIDKFGKSMIKLSVALLLMTVVIRMLGEMDQNTLIQGGIAIAAFTVIMVGLMAATKLISGSKNVDSIGGTLLKIALAIGAMALVVKLLGEMDRATLIQGGIAIIAFSGIIVGLMAATKLINGSKNVDAIGSTLLKIGIAIGIMGLIVKLLGGMDQAELIKGGLAIVAFSGIIVGLMAATKLISGSKNIDKIGGTLLAISGAIAIMALTAFMLSLVSWEGFAKGTVMITAFAGIIVALMAATRLLTGSKNVDKIGTTLLAVAGAIGILALIAVLLGMVPVENLKRGTIVVTILSGVMAGLIAVTSIAKKCLGNIIAITVAIAVMAGAVYLLSTIPAESAIRSAVILGGLMIVMTGVLAALSFIGKMAKDTLMGVLALTAMAVPLIAFVGVLAAMQNVQNATNNALALSILATAMTLLLIPLTIVGAAGLTGAPYLGALALLAMAVPLVAFVGVLALMQNVQNATENVNLLITMMTTMTNILVVLAIIGPLAMIGVSALSSLTLLMVGIGALAVGIGYVMDKIPELQSFLTTGLDVLNQLAHGIGEMVGNLVSGFLGAVTDGLPEVAEKLSDFMGKLTGFIEGAKTIDQSVLTGVGILAASIIALTVADFISGIASFSPMSAGLAQLGTDLSTFMTNAQGFITGAAAIDPAMMDGVKTIAETILLLTAANVVEGLTSWLTGGSSLENFASQLGILGMGLNSFITNVGAFSEDQAATVTCAANAIKTLAQASSEIPNVGGLLSMLVGENDLATFATQFPILGTGLATFLANVGTFTDEQVATVKCAADAIKTLAQASSEIPNAGGLLGMLVGENDLAAFATQFPILGIGLATFLANVDTFTEEQVATVQCAADAIKTLAQASSEIPNAGGWLGQIVGDNDLGTFAAQFPVLGTGLRGFLDNVGTFADDQVSTINCAANAIKILAQASASVPDSGGWLQKLIGESDLSTFATQLPNIGKGIKAFTDELGTFDQAKVSTVYSGVAAINALANLANADLKGATKNLSDFGDDLPDLASNVADFCTNMPSSDAMTSAVDSLDKLLGAIDSIADANSGVLSEFAENLETLGTTAVNNFVSAFTSTTAQTDLANAAETLAQKVVDGIEDKEDDVEKAATSAAKKAVDGVETQEDEMTSAGKDLGSGLVAGINAKKSAVYWAAYALGKEAVRGEKDGQNSASPSKETIKAGKWLGEGLVIGMGKISGSVYNAAYSLGETATGGISSTISRIADLVSTDIDAQPTIRPVLDLSDVRSGASAISGMLGNGASVGVLANVGNISSMMNSRIQNGAENDVVTAINKLRKDLGNVGNTTYQVNGITYDDGSNINEAVKTIVREVRIGRRV